MNRNDFLDMMKQSASVNRQMTGEVFELIDIFPYFQSAHLILLKGLQNNGDVKFENQLKQSSVHIADREVLYYLLQSKHSSVIVDKTEKAEEYEQVNPESTDSRQTVIESAMNSESLIIEIEKESGEIIDNQNDFVTDMDEGHPIIVSSGEDDDSASGVMILLEDDNSDTGESFFYMDPGFSIPENNDLLELDTDETVSDSAEADFEGSQKNSQAELIDKFIIANPRIEPIRDKTALPQEDISKPFIEGDGGFVTETLARIYVQQGYYSKAIDIYEKLSLKFPEKSSYFAFQIEKVKEYLKN